MPISINTKAYLTIIAGLSGVSGLALVGAPGVVDRVFGIPPEPGAKLLTRLFGTDLLFEAVDSYLLRDTQDPQTLRALAAGNVVQDALVTLLVAHGIRTKALNAWAWALVLLFGSIGIVNLLILLQEDQREERAPAEPAGRATPTGQAAQAEGALA
jgi:hypothetical protein